VAIIEQGVAPGGGAWLGGQLFSAMCVSSFFPPPQPGDTAYWSNDAQYQPNEHSTLWRKTFQIVE